jgi:hypothetical protein
MNAGVLRKKVGWEFMYMFSQPLAFTSIPKAYGFEAATHFPLTFLGGTYKEF